MRREKEKSVSGLYITFTSLLSISEQYDHEMLQNVPSTQQR
jgi:hypothetical protein